MYFLVALAKSQNPRMVGILVGAVRRLDPL